MLWSKVDSVGRYFNFFTQVRHVRVGWLASRWYLQACEGRAQSKQQEDCERLRVYRAGQDLSGVAHRMGRWDVQGLGQRGGNGETGGDYCCGYGYAVWADRDSGRTSECEMKAEP